MRSCFYCGHAPLWLIASMSLPPQYHNTIQKEFTKKCRLMQWNYAQLFFPSSQPQWYSQQAILIPNGSSLQENMFQGLDVIGIPGASSCCNSSQMNINTKKIHLNYFNVKILVPLGFYDVYHKCCLLATVSTAWWHLIMNTKRMHYTW